MFNCLFFSPRYYYRRRPFSWVIFSILITVVIILSATISVRYTYYSDDDGLNYSPNDTRIISVNNVMCQGLKMTVDVTSDPGYTAQLYMLKSPPLLTGHEKFSIQESVYVTDDFQYYYYYLHPGSNFTVSVCEDNLSGRFKLIQGNKNFRKFQHGSYSVPHNQDFPITSVCGDSMSTSNITLTYNVTVEDYYYFILENEDYEGTIVPTLSIDFYRTRYQIDTSNDTVVDQCEESTDGLSVSCSVSVPFSGQTAYLEIVTEESSYLDWSDEISVETSCQPRVWVYVVISISTLIGALAVVVPVMICVCICINKKAKQAKNASPAANAPLLSDPVINPQPQQNPPAYGSNYGAPPAYKQ